VRFLGVDLAWGEGSEDQPANCSGVVVLDASGTILDRQVGQCYGRWLVSANSVNLSSPRQAGCRLRERLEQRGWSYSDGRNGPPTGSRTLSECYPYATIVGAEELGYEDKRPPYKRKPKGMRAAEFFPMRSAACDELIRRVADLKTADPPIDVGSHAETAALVTEPSPRNSKLYKRREDLLDAAICAWTAAFWHRHGNKRCQVLGDAEHDGAGGPIATIIAPARPEQRRARPL
jgi:predicted RNase H-like nuclease